MTTSQYFWTNSRLTPASSKKKKEEEKKPFQQSKPSDSANLQAKWYSRLCKLLVIPQELRIATLQEEYFIRPPTQPQRGRVTSALFKLCQRARAIHTLKIQKPSRHLKHAHAREGGMEGEGEREGGKGVLLKYFLTKLCLYLSPPDLALLVMSAREHARALPLCISFLPLSPSVSPPPPPPLAAHLSRVCL